MTSDQWNALSSRAWRNATVAADQAELDEARFWVGRAKLAARYARRPPC
jgi:hypothetical protein